MSSVGTKWNWMKASNIIRFLNINTCETFTENTAYVYVMNKLINVSNVQAFHIVVV